MIFNKTKKSNTRREFYNSSRSKTFAYYIEDQSANLTGEQTKNTGNDLNNYNLINENNNNESCNKRLGENRNSRNEKIKNFSLEPKVNKDIIQQLKDEIRISSPLVKIWVNPINKEST